MAAMTILTVAAAPALARGPQDDGLSNASHRDVSRSIGRGQSVNARTAAQNAKSQPRAQRAAPLLSPDLGARPSTTVQSPSRNLATGGGSMSSLSGPRIVAQPPAVVTKAFAGTTADEACGGCEPPDPWIAVSPSHVVQATNGMVRVSTRAGTTLVSMPTWALFAVPVNRFDADPRILWDAVHGRWVGVITTYSGDFLDNGLRFAVSETSDPTAGWTVYPIDFGPFLPDYPGISSSSTRIVLTSNDFDGPTYVGPTWLMLDWSNILAGTDLYIGGDSYDDATFGNFRPAIALSAVTNIPVIYENGISPGYFELGGTAHAPTVENVYDLTDFGIADFSLPPAPVQPGAISIANAADERPTDAVYRGGQLWFVATGDYFDGVDHWAMARYTRVSTSANGTAPTAATDLLELSSGTHYFMPGVGINADGSVFMVATKTDPTSIYPTTVFGALLNGSILQAFQDIEASTTAYTGSAGRWGDYVGVAADPSGAGAVWLQHELVGADGKWRTSVARIVSDGVLPSLPGVVGQAQVLPATLGATVPVRTSWGAATDADSGVRGYLVERSDAGGAFFGMETTATSITAPLIIGQSVRYRVSAIDAVGNVGLPRYGATYRPTRYQSTQQTTLTGSWGSSTSASFSGGSTRYSSTAGASATFTATAARSISVIATKALARGSFKVYVDGVFKATISTYSSTTKYRQLVYQFNWSAPGTHKIKIVVSGTSGHPRVDVDAFVVLR
jgi:hypothetical protein